ncbi:hypothetical protein [Brevibacillus nitrificans]|uniref:hypothetical protein n=1 Tax=Brevibacillus nitrificans TaxID=651560 RepID=UPI00286CFA24|nr:hypothetical protein [Brevibacillus nitrificans]
MFWRHQLDVWVIVGREYHEDPIMETLFPAAVDSSRRLTIFAFFLNQNKTVSRYVLHANPAFDPYYERIWKSGPEDQWECLCANHSGEEPETDWCEYIQPLQLLRWAHAYIL